MDSFLVHNCDELKHLSD